MNRDKVASSCCQSLIGCRECLDVWWDTINQCPKCRSDEGRAGRIDLGSLDGVFKVLMPQIGDDLDNE